MRLKMHRAARITATGLAVVLPIGLGVSPSSATLHAEQPRSAPVAQVSTAPLAVEIAPPQDIAPQTTIDARLADHDGKVEVRSAKGTRTWTASALAGHDLPTAALRAYQRAAAEMARTDPSCRLPWTLLAGIGRVESDHGRYDGSVLGSDGVSRPAIIGVALNGNGPVAAIPDTDRGRLDGDKVWDRAVGPMQFIPSTWKYAGRDGDGDGRNNPGDLDDAALAAAGYLCAGSGDVRIESVMRAAIFRYNPSDYYVALVMAFERGYRTGVFVIPSPPEVEAPAPTPAVSKHAPADAAPKPATGKTSKTATVKPTGAHKSASGATAKPSGGTSSGTTGTPKPAPKPSPSPDPSPSPSPTPAPSPAPALVEQTGVLSACGDGWCLAGRPLDLGPADQLAARAVADFDGDKTIETNAEEVAGLAGGNLTVSVKQGTNLVYVIAGEGYRNADGSFAS
jgi:membrane-bound lytic murein transglycosylase B